MSQPNILLLLIDDLGWTDIGCYGSAFYETPNLDRLASQGVRMTDAYASSPVCSPTRASILTGKYPANVGITNYIPGNAFGKLMGVPYFHALPDNEVTVADALRAGGYQTWHVGKWHLGEEGNLPQNRGFDVNIAGQHWGLPQHGYFAPWGMRGIEDAEDGEYLTDRLTTEAINLIENRDPERPFFLNLCHYAVHTPIESPPELVRKYEQKAHDMGLDKVDPIEVGEAFPCLHKKDERIERRTLQSDVAYAAMVENLDTNTGRLLDALDGAGLADDTLVFFTSDNGGLSTAEGSPTCNAPLLEGKGWMYEGGSRVCQIARWPGVVAPGRECSEPVTSTDFFPTFLEVAGLDPMPRQHEDGVSMMPLLRGEPSLDRAGIYWHYPHYSNQGDSPACAVRAGDFKLIKHFEDGKLELFNLREDIGETNDLAAELPDVVGDLHRQLTAWMEAVEAKIPDVNPDYDEMLAGRKPSPDYMGHIPGSDHPGQTSPTEPDPSR